MGSNPQDFRSEIAFFDLETTFPTRPGQVRAILEFGSIVVCPRTLVELTSYGTLVKPHDLSLLSARGNGITPDSVVSAPTFADIADKVYDILHGRIWAGHNIIGHDCVLLREAFANINRAPPEPKGIIDSLALLTQTFGRRAGDMKMASLASYFGLGKQSHRSMADVRMNLEVLKHCATVFFLESSYPDMFIEDSWVNVPTATSESTEFLDPHEVSIPSVTVSVVSFNGFKKIQLLHRDTPLLMRCNNLKVRYGISARFPKLSFVVDASPNLCDVLDECDNIAERFLDSSSEWRPVVSRKPGFYNSPTIRLQLPTVAEVDGAKLITEIYKKQSPSASSPSPSIQRYDVADLEALIRPGSFLDAYFSLNPYDYLQNAGIRLVAKKLVVDSN